MSPSTKNKTLKERNERRRLSGHLTKELIVETAIQCFAESGYDVVSMRHIAKRAKLTAPGIYFYFEDKHALYVECCRHAFTKMTANINRQLTTSEPPAKKVRNFVHSLVAELLMNPNTAKLFQRELVSTNKDILQFLERVAFEDTFNSFSQTLAQAVNTEEPELLAISIYSLALGHIQFSQVLESVGNTSLSFTHRPEELANHIIQMAGIHEF